MVEEIQNNRFDTTFYAEQLKTLMNAVHYNMGWLDEATNNQFLDVLLKGFIEYRMENRLTIQNLAEFVQCFNRFLDRFKRYMDIEKYFLGASPEVKEDFLSSPLYVRLPQKRGDADSEEKMQTKISQINKYMGLLHSKLKDILAKLAEKTTELSDYIGEYHFPDNFLEEPVLVRKDDKIILKVESIAFQDKKRYVDRTPLKSLNRDVKTLWHMTIQELPKESLFSKKEYVAHFTYPFASISQEY